LEEQMNLPSDSVAKFKEEALRPVKEVLEHLYRTILCTAEFALMDGTKARLDGLSPPELNDDSMAECAFDVLFEDGAYLEFTLRSTGWGKPVVSGESPAQRKRRRRDSSSRRHRQQR
jgi:hypothetical protein